MKQSRETSPIIESSVSRLSAFQDLNHQEENCEFNETDFGNSGLLVALRAAGRRAGTSTRDNLTGLAGSDHHHPATATSFRRPSLGSRGQAGGLQPGW